MKRLFVFLSIIATGLAATAQIFDPDRPMILPFTVCADSINAQMHDNLKNPYHGKVTEQMGWVEIPNTFYQHNGKSMGIILVRTGTYCYIAFDARCPRCFYEEEVDGSKLKMCDSLEAICPVCKAEAQGLVNVGAPSMTRYNHENRAPAKMNTYIVEESKKGKKTYLLIYNAPNGTGNKWKEQPENRFLIGKDVFNKKNKTI
ncbi:MAG: hypothetical protein K2H98_03625 [Duncaniella sp.]|nr:hypothetical protein [Duncaniella sp.]